MDADDLSDVPGQYPDGATAKAKRKLSKPQGLTGTGQRRVSDIDEVNQRFNELLEQETRAVDVKPDKIKQWRKRATSNAKKVLKIDEPHDFARGELDGSVDNVKTDPAFNPQLLFRKDGFKLGGRVDRTFGALETFGEFIAHPKRTVKTKATKSTAGRLAKAQHPYLSRKADLELLKVQDELSKAEDSASSENSGCDEALEVARDRKTELDRLHAHRESIRVAWITSRHVRKVRVVPKGLYNFPKAPSPLSEEGKVKSTAPEWSAWLGHLLLWMTQNFSAHYVDDFDRMKYDLETLKLSMERIIIASAPWQVWLMRVREVYRWEDPWQTSMWFCLYWTLWYYEHIMGFLYSYILYMIITNYFFPSTVDEMKKSLNRALDRGSTAYMFSEYIDRHGNDEWLQPLLDEIGPYLQIQIIDLANFLEILANFSSWKVQKKTIASLYFFATCLLVTIVCDTEYCLKIFWFIVGGTFFVCWPISSRWPRYRYLVSPFRWVLWDIPTNAEWSFMYLRNHAQESRERMLEEKVQQIYEQEKSEPPTEGYTGHVSIPEIRIPDSDQDTSLPESESDSDESFYSATSAASILEHGDIISFKAQWNGWLGRFAIFTDGVRFVRSSPYKEMWTYTFNELVEMTKLPSSSTARFLSLEALQLTFTDGHTIKLDGLKKRDQAFNSVIGFSSIQWQAMHPED